MLFDKFHGVSRDAVGDILIFPKGVSAAFHEPNSPNTVHNTHIMSVARTLIIEQLGMCFARRFTLEIVFIAHLDGSRRVVVGNLPVFDEDTRHTVCRCRHDVMIIKADVSQGGRQ